MSNLAQTPPQSDLDVAPLLLPAKVLRNDAEALSAAHELAQAARLQAARRDKQRKLPWAEIEHFTRSGLGSISIPREYGGPQVSFVTLAEVFTIISAAAIHSTTRNDCLDRIRILSSLPAEPCLAPRQRRYRWRRRPRPDASCRRR